MNKDSLTRANDLSNRIGYITRKLGQIDENSDCVEILVCNQILNSGDYGALHERVAEDVRKQLKSDLVSHEKEFSEL